MIGFLCLTITSQPGPTPAAIRMTGGVPTHFWPGVFETLDRVEEAVLSDGG